MSKSKDNSFYISQSKTLYSGGIPRMAGIKETAQLFGLPEHLVRQKVLNGEVIAIKAGRRYLVNVNRFADYLNTNTLPVPAHQAADNGVKPIPVEL